ncbi:MAG TPA: cyclic nucleotide-binding domain-containing protein [Thermoplasmata archaeon]|nr:cyclic nucleotide-binding domain-containing protein [Thermoplasmata archaeon]
MTTGPTAPTPLRLAEHPFFRGMDAAFVAHLERAAAERSWPAGSYLFEQGGPADTFYLLFEGKVALELGAPDRARVTIETLGPRDVLGWSWLVPPHRWRFDARAVKATRALALGADALVRRLEERPAEGYRFLMHLVPVIGERLERARVQVLDLYGH